MSCSCFLPPRCSPPFQLQLPPLPSESQHGAMPCIRARLSSFDPHACSRFARTKWRDLLNAQPGPDNSAITALNAAAAGSKCKQRRYSSPTAINCHPTRRVYPPFSHLRLHPGTVFTLRIQIGQHRTASVTVPIRVRPRFLAESIRISFWCVFVR